jgi:plastocyanin
MRGKIIRVLVTALVAGSLLAPTTVSAARYRIRATEGDEWNPSFKHIVPGGRIVVVWKNPTNDLHDVTSYGRNWDYSKRLPAGESRTKRFRRKGVYKYRCRVHSTLRNGQCDGMCGVIHIAN